MSRRNQKDTNKHNSLLRYFPQPTPATHADNKKKITIPDPSSATTTPEHPIKTLPLLHHLKSLEMEEILRECPKIRQLISALG